MKKQRLHQPEFRGRVLLAYDNKCGVCSLGHRQLLDAAHITADSEEQGTPEVVNGLCLCKIHHAAYDANLLGISPDYRIVVGEKLLQNPDDNPMVRYGFRDMAGRKLALPSRRSDRPSRERLETWFAAFLEAS
ncbi:HNH endonuclease [Nocardia donostiensis]|uniref:HNH endonuclease n=1 Tax=Nocardia donostiensis TaxID=1538463 RepID=UPI0020CB10A6|nr:HNH endonuclease [Nocardia donostiensis]